MKTLTFCIRDVICALLALLMLFGAEAVPAYALDVQGVRFQAQEQAAGIPLVLNGAGIRRFGTADMYAAGLYLSQRQTTSDAVLNNLAPKQLRVVLLRDVNAREVENLFMRGLVSNSSDDELAAVIPEILNLGNLIAEQGKLRKGDSFQLDWYPGKGTTITIFEKGRLKPIAQFFGATDFVKVMLRVWLGKQPADEHLKSALLGQPS